MTQRELFHGNLKRYGQQHIWVKTIRFKVWLDVSDPNKTDEQRDEEIYSRMNNFFNALPDTTRCHWTNDANVQGGKYWLARCEGGRFGVEGCRCGEVNKD